MELAATSQHARSMRLPAWAAFALLALVTFAAYWPALQGDLLWDDDAHIPKSELQSVEGLGRIWFDIGATQQYYPLLFSWFWVQHRLWGDDMLGYHLVNLLLHVGAAFLVYLILRQLKIPGALLAAAIFAVHPVHAESVAWVTEQKNTLSGVFYLGAMLAYLKFDETRARSPYVWALVLFVLSMLSKTVTVTLPPALLIILWWQRGKISWKRDVVPLLPFFGLALADGLFTVWFERAIIGAQGRAFEPTWAEKPLLAGRALWFYLYTLVWPVNLIFVNPRWQLDPSAARQWLFPLGAIALVAVCWSLRGWSRGPLAALLFFLVTLAPVLGFLNVYFFQFSFVADHFQYLASLGIIVLFAAGITRAIDRLAPTWQALGRAGCMLVVSALAFLTNRQSTMYGDVMTLYATTLERNPTSWLIQNNLGSEMVKRNDPQGAIARFQKSLSYRSDHPLAHNNLGHVLVDLGQPQEALVHFEEAARLTPDDPNVHNNLAGALFNLGRMEEALEQCRQALALKPDLVAARGNLGNILFAMGRPQEAIEHFRATLKLKPDFPKAEYHLGLALASVGQIEAAIPHFETAARLDPAEAEIKNNLGAALLDMNRAQEAVAPLQQAAQMRPNLPEVHCNLGRALMQSGKLQEALASLEEAIRLNPEYAEAFANLADAQAQQHRAPQAIAAAEKALELARQQGSTPLVEQLTDRLAALRRGDMTPPTPRGPALPPAP